MSYVTRFLVQIYWITIFVLRGATDAVSPAVLVSARGAPNRETNSLCLDHGVISQFAALTRTYVYYNVSPQRFLTRPEMHEREMVLSGGFEWATQLRHFKRLN